MVSILITRQPWHPELDAWAQQALSLAETCSNAYVEMNAFYQMAFYRVFTGQLGKASHPINLLRPLSRSQKVPPLTLLLQKCVETIYYRFWGMHEEVLRTVPEAMEISRKTGIRGFDYLLAHGAASALNVQDFKGAEEFLVKLDSSLESLRK